MSLSPTTITTLSSCGSVENIKCFLRCKPLRDSEQELNAKCIEISNDKTTISVDMSAENKDEKIFSLDKIFSEEVNQEEIFDQLGKPLLQSFIQGYNCTIFAYGQTGAGKTHTIFGPIEDLYEEHNTMHGLIPRILSFLFNNNNVVNILSSKGNGKEQERGDNREVVYAIKCSCLEIYQDHLIDLLKKNSDEDEHLIIREDQDKGMYIENLTKVNILNEKNAKELLMTGMKNRHVASTNMNAASSRSHLIFTLFLESTVDSGNEETITKTSRMHLIDLAGSERQKATQAMGERIKEAGNINKSLSILGNVINALIEQGNSIKNKFVPFRDSKLTHFLKDSLGGNSKTIIIANISQSVIQLQETISTLNFVQRAKMITNKTAVNENISEKRKIALLENEIKRLKEIISNTTTNNHHQCDCGNDETQVLLKKINELIAYEDIIAKKLKCLDVIGLNSIEQFFNNKERFEKDICNFVNMNTMNEKVNVLKQELELYKYLGQYYQNRKKIKEVQAQFSNDFIMKYISVHEDIKGYLSESFGIASQLILTDKAKYEKSQFQLKELAIDNEEHVRTIEGLQNENFLLSMELIKFNNDNNILGNDNDEDIFVSNNNNEKNHHKDISEFSFTPTKSGNHNYNSSIKQNNSNNKLFLSNLKKSFMKSEQSFKTPNNNDALILKENLNIALKSKKEHEDKANTLTHLNNSIQSENGRLRNDLANYKEEINTLASINSFYKEDIKRLNNQLCSLRKLLSNSISEISIKLSENNSLISQLSLLSDDILSHMTQCLTRKLSLDQSQMIFLEKNIINLQSQKKQLIEEIKLINNEYDQTLTSQEKFNAKIRIYNRIKEKGDCKKDYDDLVSLIYSILPQCNNENMNDSNNKQYNTKTAIERIKHAAETIDLFNFYKETQVNKFKQKNQRDLQKTMNTIISKSPLPKKK